MSPPTQTEIDWAAPGNQREHIERVSSRIGGLICAWCDARITEGRPEFHADELRRWIAAHVPTAPASADRILRALRKEGRVRYSVVNRRASLYRLEAA